jgi:hypothetical protein
MPALSESVTAAMQAPLDSLAGMKGAAFDRAFVHAQVANLSTAAGYAQRLSAVAERPEVQGLMATAAARLGAQLASAVTLEKSFIVADSVAAKAAADSAATRARRRKR